MHVFSNFCKSRKVLRGGIGGFRCKFVKSAGVVRRIFLGLSDLAQAS